MGRAGISETTRKQAQTKMKFCAWSRNRTAVDHWPYTAFEEVGNAAESVPKVFVTVEGVTSLPGSNWGPKLGLFAPISGVSLL